CSADWTSDRTDTQLACRWESDTQAACRYGKTGASFMSTDRYTRWRLILGREADAGLCKLAGRSCLLDAEQENLDQTLDVLYRGAGETGPGGAGGAGASSKRSARPGASAPPLA